MYLGHLRVNILSVTLLEIKSKEKLVAMNDTLPKPYEIDLDNVIRPDTLTWRRYTPTNRIF
jgi:hypothetical protein